MKDKLLAKNTVELLTEFGASSAEVFVLRRNHFNVSARSGKLENSYRSISQKIVLRAFVDKRSASVSSFDLSEETIKGIAKKVVKMAKYSAPDKFAGLPPKSEFKTVRKDLEIYDERIKKITLDKAFKFAKDMEASAKKTSKFINNSEASECEVGWDSFAMANSHGFSDEYKTSDISIATFPIAKKGGESYDAGWYSLAHSPSKLDSPNRVGRIAAKRAVRMVGGSQKVATTEAPIVFDPIVAGSLLGNLADAVSGTAVYKNSSFLAGKIGKKIASSAVNVIDEGNMVGGLASAPYDDEGIPTRKTVVVKNGVLKSYLLDTYSARRIGKKGMKSTGNSVGSGVGPTNFYLKPGNKTPDEIIGSVKSGFYVVDLLGFGVDLTSGNYSQGASGLWIEDGKLTHPVKEVTIAGNMRDMFMNIDAVGNDLTMLGSVCCPTIKISKMMIGGK